MQIDDKVLENLEKLSHLRIDNSKKDEIKNQLTGILRYIENLNELNTDGLPSTFSTLEGGTPMREDIPEGDDSIAKEILSHAPDARDDFFIVPAIIE